MVPSVTVAANIAAYLGIPLEDLLVTVPRDDGSKPLPDAIAQDAVLSRKAGRRPGGSKSGSPDVAPGSSCARSPQSAPPRRSSASCWTPANSARTHPPRRRATGWRTGWRGGSNRTAPYGHRPRRSTGRATSTVPSGSANPRRAVGSRSRGACGRGRPHLWGDDREALRPELRRHPGRGTGGDGRGHRERPSTHRRKWCAHLLGVPIGQRHRAVRGAVS
jgi:hypothetical protein